MKSIFKDLTGQRFGRWIVVRLDRKYYEDPISGRHFNTRWWCHCDCGNESSIDAGNLRNHSRSCGCLKLELFKARVTTHGQSAIAGKNGRKKHSRTYEIWAGIKQRCYNEKTEQFRDYGGRGISLCERWHKFENFLEDMGECPAGLQIDRYPNNDGNYETGNCRWTTAKENNNNRRQRRDASVLSVNGTTMTIMQWSRKLGIKANTIRWRIEHEWPVEQILNAG